MDEPTLPQMIVRVIALAVIAFILTCIVTSALLWSVEAVLEWPIFTWTRGIGLGFLTWFYIVLLIWQKAGKDSSTQREM